MKVVLDTNIVFSIIANTNGNLAKHFFRPSTGISYYAPEFLIIELQTHSGKLLKISKLAAKDYEMAKTSVFSSINFIDTEHIPEEFMKKAAILTLDIDFKDFKFVALSLFLDGLLWTGDRILLNGLRRKGYMNVINTKELTAIIGGL